MTEFDLNGKKAAFDAAGEMPLLRVVCDFAQLTGRAARRSLANRPKRSTAARGEHTRDRRRLARRA